MDGIHALHCPRQFVLAGYERRLWMVVEALPGQQRSVVAESEARRRPEDVPVIWTILPFIEFSPSSFEQHLPHQIRDASVQTDTKD